MFPSSLFVLRDKGVGEGLTAGQWDALFKDCPVSCCWMNHVTLFAIEKRIDAQSPFSVLVVGSWTHTHI